MTLKWYLKLLLLVAAPLIALVYGLCFILEAVVPQLMCLGTGFVVAAILAFGVAKWVEFLENRDWL